jgi:transcriptional regulator with PAS, ATPase and Fis domain
MLGRSLEERPRAVINLEEMIIGSSASMVALRSYLPKVARSRATVLITGETGTGKERVAEAVHLLGSHCRGPFVAINCAALPDGLVESEFFGHERGAFTGAIGAAQGHFGRASGGTLFLDEIGELSLHAQAKLLRAIESREVMPVGASRAVPVDVRIVAATNQPLEDLVERRQFRADLFYRLNVGRLCLPLLKDRKGDIPLLLNHAIAEFNQREQRTVGSPDGELLQCLLAHDWPGNIRELRNLVEAVFIDPPCDRITLSQLPPVFRELFSRYRSSATSDRDQLIEVLKRTRWNKAEAAKQLNWSRMTLYRKLARYNITRSS